MRGLVGVTVLGFTGYSLTLASLPAYAAAGGAGETTAGLVTAVFLVVTIVGQGLVPAATARFGVGPVLAGGMLALGAPSPLYAVGDRLGWLVGISAARGIGFAVLTVLGSVLAAHVAPPERRGEAIGLYGLATAVPNLAAVPAGVALVLHGHAGWLAWLAAAPVLALPFVPGLARAVGRHPAMQRAGGSARRAVAAALAPSAVLLLVTSAGGALVTFLPIARPDGALATVALLGFGLTGALTRWRAGIAADRAGSRLLLPLSLAGGALGLAVVAAGLAGGAGWVLVGAALFGAAYGAVQNLTLLLAFARVGSGEATVASALWNACFDGGTAIGAVLPGLLVAGIGLPWTYVVVSAVLGAATPLALRAAVTRGAAATG